MQDRIYKPKRFKNGVITEGSILSYNTQNSDLFLSISCQKLSKVVFKWELLPENIKNSLYEIVLSFTKGVGNE